MYLDRQFDPVRSCLDSNRALLFRIFQKSSSKNSRSKIVIFLNIFIIVFKLDVTTANLCIFRMYLYAIYAPCSFRVEKGG